jgi:hypothetical protein
LSPPRSFVFAALAVTGKAQATIEQEAAPFEKQLYAMKVDAIIRALIGLPSNRAAAAQPAAPRESVSNYASDQGFRTELVQ